MITPHPVNTQSPAPAKARRPGTRTLGSGTPRMIAGSGWPPQPPVTVAAPAPLDECRAGRTSPPPPWEYPDPPDDVPRPALVPGVEPSSDPPRPRRRPLV